MGTFVICAVLVLIVTAIIIFIVKKHKNAKKSGTCSCGCSGCSKKCS